MRVVQIIGWISFAVACVVFLLPDSALRLRIALACTVVAVIAGVIVGSRGQPRG